MKHILIVEDDADTRELLETYLKKIGFTTASASDGKEALTYLQTSQPDLIVADLLMPHLDGESFYRELLKTHHKTIPVLFISGAKHLYLNFIEDNWLRTTSLFLSKPFEFSKIKKNIEKLLQTAYEQPLC